MPNPKSGATKTDPDPGPSGRDSPAACLDNLEQEQQPSSSSSTPNYSNIAAKALANIRRLQENMNSQSPLFNQQQQLEGNNQEASSYLQQLSPLKLASASQRPTSASPSSLSPSSPPPPPSVSLTSSLNALVTIDPNWQSTKKNLRERNAVMYNNAMMADVYFVVGGGGSPSGTDTKKIPAHKYIMATGSTVFYAMFYGGLSSDSKEKETVIEVPDVEPVAFLTMLKYLYCDTIALEPDNVLPTLYCAKKYIIPYLARECVKFLESSLTAKNACLLLSQSRLFEEPELMQRCWEVIDAQAELALTSEGFTDIDLETLKSILQRETLNCKETVVFKAALNWAEAECIRRRSLDPNLDDDADEIITPEMKREVLGSAMYLIRFPAMSVHDFADEVATSGILTLQETTDIFLNFTATKQKPSVAYPCIPRKGLKIQVCHRFQSSAYRSNQWRYRGRCDSIQFCVDKRIFIIGYGLYGSSNGSSDYKAKIELKTSYGRSLAENTAKFFSDGSSNTFRVFFEQPVQVEPDQFYTASVILDGDELSYFGQEGMSEITVGAPNGVTFQFQCSAESTNGTGVQGGQIPELLLYGPYY